MPSCAKREEICGEQVGLFDNAITKVVAEHADSYGSVFLFVPNKSIIAVRNMVSKVGQYRVSKYRRLNTQVKNG